MSEWKTKFYDSYNVLANQQVNKSKEEIAQIVNSQKIACDYIIKKFFKDVEKKSNIVDLGCGVGSLVNFLCLAGYSNANGIDISKELLTLGKSAGISNLVLSDIRSYLKNQKDNSIEVIILKDVIEHFPNDELFELLEEINKKLTNNGLLLLHLPNAQGLFGMAVLYSDITHERAYTKYSIRQILSLSGFFDVKTYEQPPFPFGVKGLLRNLLWKFMVLPFRLIYRVETGFKEVILSQNFFVTARKV